MKKISVILLALSLILCFAACAPKDKNPATSGDESTNISSEIRSDFADENNYGNENSPSSKTHPDQAPDPSSSDKNTDTSKVESNNETVVDPDGTQTSSKKENKDEAANTGTSSKPAENNGGKDEAPVQTSSNKSETSKPTSSASTSSKRGPIETEDDILW